MKIALKKLFQQIGLLCDEDIEINGIEFDSRKINEGNLFVAISGHISDGHTFIQAAVDNGAVAIIGEKELKKEVSVPYYQVENSRSLLSKLANAFFQEPQYKHKMIGITGTNGKTTSAYMLHHILTSNGKTASLIGTVGYIINGEQHESSLTTPDAITLQKMIFESKDEYVVMEVSSHGLDQYRVACQMFDYALFTNLTHEHLDYHLDLETYYQSKKKLFNCLKTEGKAIVGTYTHWGERLYRELYNEKIPVFSYGQKKRRENIYLKSYTSTPTATLIVQDHGEEYQIHMKIPGKHNLLNALGSYICARDIGFSPGEVIYALEKFEGAPGRFEQILTPIGSKVIIDYAHTPDGLSHALETATYCINNDLYHIFGFRGNRDRSKRKEMVEISQKYCNHVYLTLDDLNGIEEELMVKELFELSKPYANVTVIKDRSEAIYQAIGLLQNGDGLIITGKGPEKYNEQYTYPTLTDKETVLRFLQESIIYDEKYHNQEQQR
ncbi:UDP-N-acetylmuramoyl-L-alanyl-D-glutamate--2,6-diaminopimelate ligase [Bacillus luteolus]|uniref:UDP-N-acetylmuramyl-tripeptide synthetase n=1 Tax=Litchfieldia luteola TaxID=682179 RepID=A0ABR9QIX3_9BACI|nr:UDP-N-acetylmuramoyl-L-alanyl-D-glutamate--2,6-diaminopimelate ligase [Cytobacillus luteolus]MBE4908449.1 UDP-N-acetylmuramoyl-L-alanyl-D-glutamate--2,6-diaminopimelate ligase [Cytobacillus luteolus]MBP1941298.1 UDP-N-acetylmuramoyl-L-alanyl-D-glutamate--2,6-diaminopimelate ligase [Cytobacillus luteolus]